MTKQTNVIRVPQPYLRRYRIPLELIGLETILVKDLTIQTQTIIDVFYLDTLDRIPGHLFVYIDQPKLRDVWPTVRFYYFKVDANAVYRYTESKPNPLCLVLKPMGNDLAPKKIQFTEITQTHIEILINENGTPPLCYLTAEAEKYQIESET